MEISSSTVFGIRLFKGEHKQKFIKRVLLILALTMVVESTIAKPYIAQYVDSRQTSLSNEFSFMNGVALNESSLVYFARLNNIEGLYHFNADTLQTSLLRSFPQIGNPGDPWTGRYHAAKEGLALLSVRGKLYATDGTSIGTSLIRDFGAYSCCGSFPIIQSVIKGIYFIDGMFYIVTRNENLPEPLKSELWKTDGTSEGTKQISSGHSPIRGVFSASIDNNVSVLFLVGISGTELWKVNEDESTEIIHQLESNASLSGLGNSAENPNGTYICSRVLIQGGPSIESNLLRISNNGLVTSIEEGCHENTLTSSAERIFYLSDQGLKSTDGIANNARTEMAFLATRNPFGIGFCNISSSIFYLIPGGKVIEVDAGFIRTINVTSTVGASEIQLCSQSKMIISINIDSQDYLVYMLDASNDDFSVIRNFNSIIKSKTQNDGDHLTGVLENSRGELFSFGFLPPFFNIWSESRVIKIGQPPIVVPQLMLLLD